MSQHAALASIFDHVNLGEPLHAGGWALFPMFPLRSPELRMLSVRGAVRRGLARIEERAEAAEVRTLRLHNFSPTPLLLRDGDLFIAGKQDRVADHPKLLAPECASEIPVSCVEAGRWAHGGRADFDAVDFDAALSLRYHRRAGCAAGDRPDQHCTWERVAEHRRTRGMEDPSGSLIASQSLAPDEFAELVEALGPVYGATGLALCRSTARGPRVAELSWYADPALCEETWQGSVMAAVSSLPAGHRPPKISRTELRSLFQQLSSAPTERDGELLSLRYGRTEARALLSRERPVYLNAIHQ